MNHNIQRLYQIAGKEKRLVIGLMSGTSVDGLDIALCEFSGTGMETDIRLIEFSTVPYEEDYKHEIASVFSKRDADLQKTNLIKWMDRQSNIQT